MSPTRGTCLPEKLGSFSRFLWCKIMEIQVVHRAGVLCSALTGCELISAVYIFACLVLPWLHILSLGLCIRGASCRYINISTLWRGAGSGNAWCVCGFKEARGSTWESWKAHFEVDWKVACCCTGLGWLWMKSQLVFYRPRLQPSVERVPALISEGLRGESLRVVLRGRSAGGKLTACH